MKFFNMRLSAREKIMLQRAIFIACAAVILLFMLLSHSLLVRDVNYPSNLDTPEPSDSVSEYETNDGVDEPDFSYDSVKITFGGGCKTASMLGSNSFGTFGYTLAEMGEAYFFSGLENYFANDDMTLVGLDATLSSAEGLTMSDKEASEWFLAPPSAAGIYTSGGVEAVSLECTSTRDYGSDGYEDTREAVEAAGLLWGDSGKAIYKEYETGLSSAFYCTVLRESDADGIIGWIERAVSNHDFVALYITDSGEGETPSEEKTALFRRYIDAGADLIVGGNLTSLQPFEQYGGGFIVYSLGSLIDGGERYGGQYSALLSVELHSREGELTKTRYTLIPVLNYTEDAPWHPTEAVGEAYEDVMAFMRGE